MREVDKSYAFSVATQGSSPTQSADEDQHSKPTPDSRPSYRYRSMPYPSMHSGYSGFHAKLSSQKSPKKDRPSNRPRTPFKVSENRNPNPVLTYYH